MKKLTLFLLAILLPGCTTLVGEPQQKIALLSYPAVAEVCWTSSDNGWVCKETPTEGFLSISDECQDAGPFQFTWYSGAQLTATVQACPGNEYYLAKRPDSIAGVEKDVAYARDRQDALPKEEQGATGWLEGVADAYIEAGRNRRSVNCTTTSAGDSAFTNCEEN